MKIEKMLIPASMNKPKMRKVISDAAFDRPGGKMKNPKDVSRAKQKEFLKKEYFNTAREYDEYDE